MPFIILYLVPVPPLFLINKLITKGVRFLIPSLTPKYLEIYG